jgi:hypothetical protein
VRCVICQIVESSKAATKFGEVTATKFLMHLLFNDSTNLPRLEKGKGKKRAAGVPAASVVATVDLGVKESGAPPARRPSSMELHGANTASPGRTRPTRSCI